MFRQNTGDTDQPGLQVTRIGLIAIFVELSLFVYLFSNIVSGGLFWWSVMVIVIFLSWFLVASKNLPFRRELLIFMIVTKVVIPRFESFWHENVPADVQEAVTKRSDAEVQKIATGISPILNAEVEKKSRQVHEGITNDQAQLALDRMDEIRQSKRGEFNDWDTAALEYYEECFQKASRGEKVILGRTEVKRIIDSRLHPPAPPPPQQTVVVVERSVPEDQVVQKTAPPPPKQDKSELPEVLDDNGNPYPKRVTEGYFRFLAEQQQEKEKERAARKE